MLGTPWQGLREEGRWLETGREYKGVAGIKGTKDWGHLRQKVPDMEKL